MKVLHINSVCGIRSTGRICTDIAEVLCNKGHECKIGYGRELVPPPYQKYAVKIGNSLDLKIHAFLSRIFDKSGFGSKYATKKFIKWIKQYNPDVIHLHNIHGYYINIEILFSYLKKCNKKIIWTFHDCWPFTGHCCYFEVAKCDQWHTGCKKCIQLRRYPQCIFKGNSKNNFIKKKDLFIGVPNLIIVTPSIWLSNLVKTSFLRTYPLHIINNGISTDIFKPTISSFRKKYNLSDKKIVLGVSTIWDKLKGLNDFIKIAAMLDEKFVIILVGLNKSQIQKLPRNIIGIQRTNNTKELAQIYSTADVFVNPTYEDNYPTVNLEAQSCGTPVITYITGGSIESVPRKYWVKQGDIEAMVSKIYEVTSEESPLLFPVMDKTECVNNYIRVYGEDK